MFNTKTLAAMAAASLAALATPAVAQVKGHAAGADLDRDLAGKSVEAARYRGDDDWRDDRRRDNDDYGRRGHRRGYTETIRCGSHGRGYDECRLAGDIYEIRFAGGRGSSGSCRLGGDWGVTRRSVWVANGCVGRFEVTYRGGGRRGGDVYSGGYGGRPIRNVDYVTCESRDRNYRLCRLGTGFREVQLIDRRSNMRCRQGTDWGVKREGIWVNNGCRATFSYVYGDGRTSRSRY